jgi:hypothetical protein
VKLICFSRDRACQLHALLESAARFLPGTRPAILYKATTPEYRRGYELLDSRIEADYTAEADFRSDLLAILERDRDPYLMFAVDDQLFRRRVPVASAISALRDQQVLCFSLRLSPQITYCYSCDIQTPPPTFTMGQDAGVLKWNWQAGCRGDWAYPFSVDTTIYRTADVLAALKRHTFSNPNTLEGFLAGDPCWKRWVMMACGPESYAMNIPANLVQDTFRNLTCAGLAVEELNRRYLAGEKIDIEPLVAAEVCSCHVALPYTFEAIRTALQPIAEGK